QHMDTALASCVAISNQEEIAIAKFADQKAKSKEVKEFAEMIARDHQQFLQKLAKYAPEASRDGFLMERTLGNNPQSSTGVQPAGGTPRDLPRNENQRTIQQTAGTVQLQDHHLAFINLEREVAQECLTLAKEKMNKEEGDKFDKCFIGQQIGAHAAMKAK